MGKPAARVGDMHVCPMVTPGVPPVPHVGGPVVGPGLPTVIIGGMPAAVMGDMCTCVGPPDTIILGSTGVMIGGKPAARMGDTTTHGGMVAAGCPTVLIGETGSGGTGGGAAGAVSGTAGSTAGGASSTAVGVAARTNYAVSAINETVPAEEEQDPKKHWIKFKVVDKSNNPIENVKLRIKLPEGSIVERTTDKNGLIEIKNIETGNCKIETYWEGCTVQKALIIK